MNTALRWVTAFAAGAVAMYYLDPVTGRRRRALARDQGAAVCHDATDYASAKSRQVLSRAQGALAKTREKLSSQPVGDVQLHDRIRARLGHVIAHPAQVKVDVNDGHVVLRGSATAEEIDEVVNTVLAMRGVEDIDNRLSARDQDAVQPASSAASSASH